MDIWQISFSLGLLLILVSAVFSTLSLRKETILKIPSGERKEWLAEFKKLRTLMMLTNVMFLAVPCLLQMSHFAYGDFFAYCLCSMQGVLLFATFSGIFLLLKGEGTHGEIWTLIGPVFLLLEVVYACILFRKTTHI